MKRIVVTGGAGFIGSAFVRTIANDYEISVIDNLSYAGDIKRLSTVSQKIRFYKIDICDKKAISEVFKKEKPKFVVHFAAESHVDRSILNAGPFIDTNVKGTQMLLDIARQYDVERFINISTDEVYGDLDERGQFSEETCLNPHSPYSASKASADMLGRAYFRTFNLPVITVRPSNNYGMWQYPEKFIPVIIFKALQNKKIPVYGTGKNIREWLFVTDCAEAIARIVEKGKAGESYNLGSSEERSNIDVAKNILSLMNKPESLIEFVKDRAGHDFRYSLNSEKIKDELGWKASTNFDKGIEKTIKWYLDNFDWVKEKKNELEKYWEQVY